MVAVLPVVAPGRMVSAAVPPPTVKVGPAVMVRATVVEALRVPEVPVMVIVTGPPTVAPLPAASVSNCAPPEPEENDAVIPDGSPAADRATLAPKPEISITEMLLVPLVPWATEMLLGDAESEKPGRGFTVRAMVVVAVRLPETPLMVTTNGPPAEAVLDAASVSTLELVAGFAEKAAVMPAGNPDAERFTPLAKPFAAITETVPATLLPGIKDTAAEEEDS